MIGGFDMNSYEEVSKDGLRKVVFTQVAEKSTKCEFFEEDLCLVEFEVQEDVFNISQSVLERRRYFKLACNFLSVGLDDRSLWNIAKILNYKDCNIAIYPSDFYKINIISNSLVTLTIYGEFPVIMKHNLSDTKFQLHTIKFYKLASLKKLKNVGYWQGIDLEITYYTNNLDILMSQFKYKGITFAGCSELLSYFTNPVYLFKVDYFNTGNLFKDNTFTDNDKSFFAKVAFLRKKVLILNIEDDLSIMYKLID